MNKSDLHHTTQSSNKSINRYCVGENLLPHNHRSLSNAKNRLDILSCFSASGENPSASSREVIIDAVLYTRKAQNGGRQLKSMVCTPDTNGSRVLVTVDRSESRDIIAT